jgi:hypothetical protein
MRKMKIMMKNDKLLDFFDAIGSIKGEVKDFQFLYNVLYFSYSV